MGVAEGAVAGEGPGASLPPREPGLAHPKRTRWPLPTCRSPGPCVPVWKGGGTLGPAAPCPPPCHHCSPKGFPLTPCPLVPQRPQALQSGSSQPPRPCSPLPSAGLHGPWLLGHTPSLCPVGAWLLLPGPALGPALPLFCPGCQAPVRCELAQSRRLPCAQARDVPPTAGRAPGEDAGPQLLPPPQAYLFKPLREHIEIYSTSSSQAH